MTLPEATAAGSTGERWRASLHLVIVHRDQPDAAARLTRAVLDERGFSPTVAIVDNGSSTRSRRVLAGHVADLARNHPGCVEIIEAGSNLGFGPGANLGIRRWMLASTSPWVAIAPHDALPQTGCISAIMSELYERPEAGLASAEFGPGFDAVPILDEIIGAYWKPAQRTRGWIDVDYPHGTLLFASRAMLREVGLFDERYFAYCEEADLALRARAAGWKVGMVWGAVVVNGQLPSRRAVVDYLQLRNTLLLVREHYGGKPARARLLLAILHLISICARRPLEAPGHLRVHLRAILDYRAGRFGPPPPHLVTTDEPC